MHFRNKLYSLLFIHLLQSNLQTSYQYSLRYAAAHAHSAYSQPNNATDIAAVPAKDVIL